MLSLSKPLQTQKISSHEDYLCAVYYQSLSDLGLSYFSRYSSPNERRLREIAEKLGKKGLTVSQDEYYDEILVSLDSGLVYVCQGTRASHATTYVAAFSAEGAQEAYSTVAELFQVSQVEAGSVRLKFHYQTPHGPTYMDRKISVHTWDECQRNYSQGARKELEELRSWRPCEGSGRIGVLHGPPGTGKTSAIRSLLHDWQSWCEGHYITDPEAFFGEPHYMMEVCLSNGEDENRWRMIIVEDAEEFFAADSKERVGQGLARLLNMGDGIIGQGLKVFFLMTTNVPLATMHEAIMRPGRCYAHIHIPALTAAEATKWLGRPSGKATLAELYSVPTLAPIGEVGSPTANGNYL
jgi:hypothetical protein